MGPMLLLVLGILSAVGLGLYQFGEQHRFDMVSDPKNGGIFIIDRKSAAINYCTDKTCSLVGNGSLPSQIMGNPAALVSMQGAIMGAPAAVAAANPGQAPKGMSSNIAGSDAAVADSNSDAQNADAQQGGGEQQAPDATEHQDADAPAADSGEAAAPEGYAFN